MSGTEREKSKRFDYDRLDRIRSREELARRRQEIERTARPNQSICCPGWYLHVLAVVVAVIAIAYTIFANYPAPPISPILYQWKAMSAEMRYNENNIFYIDYANENITEDSGDDRASSRVLLYLHGFPTSSFDLHDIFGNLSRRFGRIVAPDFIGYGFSDKPRFYSYSLIDQANMVISLLDKLAIKRVHVLAHDYGDSVAQELLARVQDGTMRNVQIESVCMMNGGVFPAIHRPVLMQNVFRTPIIGTIASKFANYVLFASSLSAVFGPDTQPTRQTLSDLWMLIRLQDGYRVWGPLLKYIDERAANEDRWVAALRRSPVPLHFIYGDADPVNPAPQFEQTYRKIVYSPSIDVLRNVGHYPLLEARDAVVSSYFDFLSRHNFILPKEKVEPKISNQSPNQNTPISDDKR